MIIFITALIPIIVLIVLGFVLRRTKFLPEGAWRGIEKLTYFVLFPALLVRTIGNQSLDGIPWLSMLLVVVVTLMTSVVLLISLRKLLTDSNATFTSIFQGGVRFNTYITLAIVQGLYGEQGLAMASVAAGFMIVLVNLCCITAFVFWGEASNHNVFSIVKEVFSNPLIVACAIGWLLSLSGIGVHFIVGDILQVVGQAALPFGLLAVGAALNLKGINGHYSAITYSSIVQFGLKPFLTAAVVSFTGLTGIAAVVLIIAFMTPTAPSGYILARQLGGDTEAMASIITVQTLLAFLFMPVLGWLLLLKN